MNSVLNCLMIAMLSLSLGSCAILAIDPPLRYVPQGQTVWVDQPIDLDSEAFTVRFGAEFVPGTFKAQLDGNDITQIWTPGNQVPNGSTKMLYQDIFRGGNCAAAPNPWNPNPYPPMSPIVCTHNLHVHGDVANASSYPVTVSDRSVDFVPVQLGLIAKDSNGLYLGPDDTMPLSPNQSVKVTVTGLTYGPWPQDQTVVVEALDLLSGETNPPIYIKLNNQAPGQKVFLTPPGDFTVTAADVLGPGPGTFRFRLRARAFGSQEFVYGNLFACRAGGC